MLPATLANEVRTQVLHCLQATFNTRERQVEEALLRFFNDPENGLFKGALAAAAPSLPAGGG